MDETFMLVLEYSAYVAAYIFMLFVITFGIKDIREIAEIYIGWDDLPELLLGVLAIFAGAAGMVVLTMYLTTNN